MSNLQIADKKQALVQVNNQLSHLLKEKMEALPKDFNDTRFQQNCMTVLTDIKDIEHVDPNSVARCLLKGAFLGLDFFNKECYPIPYKMTKEKGKWIPTDIQFQMDYKGDVKLRLLHSVEPLEDIYAKIVREGDEFDEEIINGRETLRYKAKKFNEGKILGAFAVALYKNGRIKYVVMSEKEILEIRDNYSKKNNNTGKFSPAWENRPTEMYKKTVLKNLCKQIPIQFDNNIQRKAFEDTVEKQEVETIVDAETASDEVVLDGERIDKNTGAYIECQNATDILEAKQAEEQFEEEIVVKSDDGLGNTLFGNEEEIEDDF